MNKYSIGAIVLGVAVASVSLAPLTPAALGATNARKVSVVGMAKFVLRGVVTAKSGNSLTLHVSAASKSVKVFKNTDVSLAVDTKTKITQKGKNVKLVSINRGAKVKVFGVFDKKASTVSKVRWIKVLK